METNKNILILLMNQKNIYICKGEKYMALIALIKKLQDIMRNDAGVGGDEQRLTQI